MNVDVTFNELTIYNARMTFNIIIIIFLLTQNNTENAAVERYKFVKHKFADMS